MTENMTVAGIIIFCIFMFGALIIMIVTDNNPCI